MKQNNRGLSIVHISDTHGPKFHSRLDIPKCDVLIHSGDIGGRTTPLELEEFLRWFNVQPAKLKIWCAGNHDLCLDEEWASRNKESAPLSYNVKQHDYKTAREIIKHYSKSVVYLEDEEYEYEGFVFYGSPYTPSFHRQNWAFNADRGEEISKIWRKVPSDVDVLITHGPPYGILDEIPEGFRSYPGEDLHRGCEELRKVIDEKMPLLKLHCFGHIHEGPTAIVSEPINGNKVLFSNGAVLNNRYDLVVTNPPIINITK